MLRLTLRNLRANKGRFAMTTFGVILGVGFVVASFVMSDGLRSTFGELSEDITAGTDLIVRPSTEFGEPEPLDEALVAEVASVDGVRATVGYIESEPNAIQPLKHDGSGIPEGGPPQLTFGWMDDADLGTFTIVEGVAPVADDHFTMDLDAADRHGFVVGETYDLSTPQGVLPDIELVGTTRFGSDNATIGATLLHVTIDQAQRLFGEEGKVDQVPVALEPGSDAATVTAAIREVLGASPAEIVDNATLTAEQKADFNEGIDIVGNVLFGFAIVSLFVSVFIIYNTFAIVLGQRIRELGLLRAIGADAAQLRRSVLAEAAIVGVIASAAGLAAGIGIARLLTWLFATIGAELPAYPTILSIRTIGLAFIVGIGVTVASSFAPARAATSVSPIQALRDGALVTREDSRHRLLLGAALLTASVALGAFGLFGSGHTTLQLVLILGIAAVGVFLGLTLASPAIAEPLTATLGWPLARLMGPAGRLARGNASRNPRRTATTAASLMIGLSLVTTGYVVGESVKASLGNLLDRSVTADYVITGDDDGEGITPTLSEQLEATGQFSAIAGMRYDEVRLGPDVRDVTGLDLSAVEGLFDIDVTSGALPDSNDTEAIVLHDDLAAELGVSVGDTVPIEFASGYATPLEVAAIYHDTTIFEDPLVAEPVFETGSIIRNHDWIAATLIEGLDTAAVEPQVEQLQAQYPQVSIDTAAEFQQQFESAIDASLLVVNALLALAIVIALIGIANTLALSVHERTRELGLLRAVGMTRRQTRRMVRWEAVLVSLFGAVLGVAVGMLFGWGVVSALPAEAFGGAVHIPAQQIAVVVVGAAFATLIAAWLPARRAGRLDVLDAISH